MIGISQSGETADTLAAMRLARERGATRARDDERDGLAGHARRRRRAVHARGPRDRGGGDEDVPVPGRGHLPARRCAWPSCAARCRASASPSSSASSSACRTASTRCSRAPRSRCRPIADAYWRSEFFLYIGRHVGLPVALEGALKLKEISYIATDAYAAGEMKHGPIALLDDSTPVVCVAHRLAGAREARLQHAGGARARRPRDRDRHGRRRARSPRTPTPRSRCPRSTGCCSRSSP